MKKKLLTLGAALTLLLALTACSGETVTQPMDSLKQTPQEAETSKETDTPERTISGTMLLGGTETSVYLEVSDTEISFWDNASGGQLLAVAKYPQALPSAADALKGCDYTDLDEDGNSDLTASFAFADGTTASLMWFYADGGFVYNEEFSLLPGDMSAAGNGE